jgi:predicted nucleic acid-binding protein
MRYWDSSAILPLLAQESDTERRRKQLQADPQIVTWWGSKVECASALNRLLRDAVLDDEAYEQVFDDLETLASEWIEIQATEKLRQRALRLLRVHSLRSANALQLAAALIASGESPLTLPFLCSDARLNEAARKEGFPLLP